MLDVIPRFQNYTASNCEESYCIVIKLQLGALSAPWIKQLAPSVELKMCSGFYLHTIDILLFIPIQ